MLQKCIVWSQGHYYKSSCKLKKHINWESKKVGPLESNLSLQMNRVLDQEDKILQIAVATRYPFMISKCQVDVSYCPQVLVW